MRLTAVGLTSCLLLAGCASGAQDACDAFSERLGKPMYDALSGLQMGTVTDAEAAALLGEGAEGALNAAALTEDTAVSGSFEVLATSLSRYRVALAQGDDPSGRRAEVREATDQVQAACGDAS
jgi:hypothetical protein